MCSTKLKLFQNAVLEQKTCRIKTGNSTGHIKVQTTRAHVQLQKDPPEVSIIYMTLQTLLLVNTLVLSQDKAICLHQLIKWGGVSFVASASKEQYQDDCVCLKHNPLGASFPLCCPTRLMFRNNNSF